MSKVVIEIKASEIEPFKRLLEVLSDHFDELPENVQQAIKEMADE